VLAGQSQLVYSAEFEKNCSTSAMTAASSSDEPSVNSKLQVTTWELFRSWVVLKLCTSERLTTNAEKVTCSRYSHSSFDELLIWLNNVLNRERNSICHWNIR
jgi:hypothetical protein